MAVNSGFARNGMRNPVTGSLVGCAFCLVLGLGVNAQTPAPKTASANSSPVVTPSAALPTGNEVYQHYIQAIGWRAAC